MLTRFRIKRDFRLIARCLSDKPSDGDGKIPADKLKDPVTDTEKQKAANMDKIQSLLKSMMSEPLSREAEYRANFAGAPDVRRKRKSEEVEVKTEKIEETITKAAGDVAQAFGGDVKKTEAELLSKVLGKINQTSTNLSDLLIGMKVDHSKSGDDKAKGRETRGEQVKRLVNKSQPDSQRNREWQQRSPKQGTRMSMREKGSLAQPTTVNIFEGQPLGIFKPSESNHGTKLEVWEALKQRELALATSQQPANYFQKMILWTDQGKVWKFPINNEQGLEEEENVHFSEHIFLESHLEGWCPTKGPVRHFMELVCVGLSKNAFYTAQEKKDHIMWYKEYFESKKDLLTDVGAWDISKTKSNEASV